MFICLGGGCLKLDLMSNTLARLVERSTVVSYYISFDIGGTYTKFGILDESFNVIECDQFPTQAYRGGREIINQVIGKVNDYLTKYPLEGVAISSAGIIDPFKGEVIFAANAIPNYIGVKIIEMVETQTGLKTEVNNDVKCFALCEKALGNAQDVTNFLTLTIGTGIGGAIYIGDKLYYGTSFSAGEWGRVLINGRCFEDLASITALINRAKEIIEDKEWTGRAIFDLYDQNHPDAVKVVNEFYENLGTGITNLIYIFNPQRVLIGGGITQRSSFLDELLTAINKIIIPKLLEDTQIMTTKYSNHSGMLGALVHFFNMQKLRNLK